jgi:uncharacterized protein
MNSKQFLSFILPVVRQTSVFLSAEWRKLAIANYTVAPELLHRYIPRGTELDLWNGRCYISLVGFLFRNTRLRGIPVPFHTSFEEVNLRFYIRQVLPDGTIRRGVSFIREIVPRYALSFVARTVYGEPYETRRMRYHWKEKDRLLDVSYQWDKGKSHGIRVIAENRLITLQRGSEEEFITEHYWGYTRINALRTKMYAVEHPRWETYPVHEYRIDLDFGQVYGNEFAMLTGQRPASVMLAEGSPVLVRSGIKL